MSFLETVESADGDAMQTLAVVAPYGADILSAVLDMPWVADRPSRS